MAIVGTAFIPLPPQEARQSIPPMGGIKATPSGGGFFTS